MASAQRSASASSETGTNETSGFPPSAEAAGSRHPRLMARRRPLSGSPNCGRTPPPSGRGQMKGAAHVPPHVSKKRSAARTAPSSGSVPRRKTQFSEAESDPVKRQNPPPGSPADRQQDSPLSRVRKNSRLSRTASNPCRPVSSLFAGPSAGFSRERAFGIGLTGTRIPPPRTWRPEERPPPHPLRPDDGPGP